MGLSLGDAGRSLSARALVDALARRAIVWAWAEASFASGRIALGDGLGIVAPSLFRAGMLPVVEADGVAIVGEPGDTRAPLGFVGALWRARRYWALHREPWRTALRTGNLGAWRAAERVWTMTRRLTAALEQLGSPPTHAQVEAMEARHYATVELLADDGQHGDLSPAEEAVAARFMTEGQHVLVIGCGTGRESLALARRGMRVVGVDLCPAAVAVARERAREAGLGSASFETMSLARLAVPRASFDVVVIASDVLSGIPGRATRLAALTRVREAAGARGVVVVAASSGRGPLRALLEVPRAAMRGLGFDMGEPGDRFAWQGPPPMRRFYHAYADDLEIARELETARLAYEARVGGFVVALCRDGSAPIAAPRFGRAEEMARVMMMLPRVERARRRSGPAAHVATMRGLARGAPHRTALERANLRAAIVLGDRALARGAGCYRRALLELALDAGAAGESLVLGLRLGGIGHAWVGSTAWTEERFDWVVGV